jgi:hypothetical protein
MVCNSTRQAGSPTQHDSHIYTQVGYDHDGHLLRPSPHMSLVVDLVAEEPNAWKCGTEKTHSCHTGIKWCLYRMPRVHQSTERIYAYPAWTKRKLVSNYTIFLHAKYYYLHSCTGNSSNHEPPCSGVLIVWRDPLYGAHILKLENEKESKHRD